MRTKNRVICLTLQKSCIAFPENLLYRRFSLTSSHTGKEASLFWISFTSQKTFHKFLAKYPSSSNQGHSWHYLWFPSYLPKIKIWKWLQKGCSWRCFHRSLKKMKKQKVKQIKIKQSKWATVTMSLSVLDWKISININMDIDGDLQAISFFVCIKMEIRTNQIKERENSHKSKIAFTGDFLS